MGQRRCDPFKKRRMEEITLVLEFTQNNDEGL